MRTDVSIVLYGFEEKSFKVTLQTLVDSSSQIRRTWILLSGDKGQHDELMTAVANSPISDSIDIECRFDNLGFASGHNLLLRKAFDAGAQSVLVLNPDVCFSTEAMQIFMSHTSRFPKSLMGPTLQQIDSESDTDATRVDSLGIGWTKTGRHFDIGQGDPWNFSNTGPKVTLGVTGACLLVPYGAYAAVVDRYGHFFDDLFIAYREDAELGIRALRAGVQSIVLPIVGFRHIRSTRGFERKNPFVNMLGVRNRFIMHGTLGQYRPGSPPLAFMRDFIVVAATLVYERSSVNGLRDAWRVRRHCRHLRAYH